MKYSNVLTDISAALVAIQSELRNPQKKSENPFFKSSYAALDGILDDIRPVLAKHGVAVVQDARGDADSITVSTVLIHKTGQYIESDGLRLPLVKKDPQSACSAVTYARRYSLMAMLDIIGTDEDDDGNKATHEKEPAAPQKPKGNIANALAAIKTAENAERLAKIAARCDASAWTEIETAEINDALKAKKAEFANGTK